VPSQLRKPGADDSAPDRYSADRDDPFPMGEQERRQQQQEGGPDEAERRVAPYVRDKREVSVTPCGSETRIRSCGGAVVLVDEPAEEIPPTNVARTDGDRVPRFGLRDSGKLSA
jgi:hypothetical protein